MLSSYLRLCFPFCAQKVSFENGIVLYAHDVHRVSFIHSYACQTVDSCMFSFFLFFPLINELILKVHIFKKRNKSVSLYRPLVLEIHISLRTVGGQGLQKVGKG
jgi:hypothetical protein